MKIMSTSFYVLLVLTVLTGAVYPMLVTSIAQQLFPTAANGSMVEVNGKILGSALIGQPRSSPEYFWSRPSATAPHAYNAAASGGSNLGPTNPALMIAVEERLAAFRGSEARVRVPVDVVTTSGSGIDPHISPAGAEAQVPRIAAARGIRPEQVKEVLRRHIEPRTFGLLGEKRVNVLLLNIALDQAFLQHGGK